MPQLVREQYSPGRLEPASNGCAARRYRPEAVPEGLEDGAAAGVGLTSPTTTTIGSARTRSTGPRTAGEVDLWRKREGATVAPEPRLGYQTESAGNPWPVDVQQPNAKPGTPWW